MVVVVVVEDVVEDEEVVVGLILVVDVVIVVVVVASIDVVVVEVVVVVVTTGVSWLTHPLNKRTATNSNITADLFINNIYPSLKVIINRKSRFLYCLTQLTFEVL
jgi:hypothetical protein